MRRSSRRGFLGSLGASAVALAVPAEATTTPRAGSSPTHRLRPGGSDDGFDPWLEIDGAAFRHNVREMSRRAAGRPILAVVKNNAYGLGDTIVGPLFDSCPEVAGVACVRVHEALAMRRAGVRKPILNMAEVSEQEAADLVRHRVWPSLWLDDAGERMDRLAARLGRAIPVHLCIDTGLGREGMPEHRARPWIEALARRRSLRIEGTWTMFLQDLEFDREQLSRFLVLAKDAERANVSLGRLHAAPTYDVFYLPEARLDMVRCGQGLFGLYPDEEARARGGLQPVFRLRARVVRVERFRPGDGAGFGPRYTATQPTWIALLPIGQTDGYPGAAAGTCQVLIGKRLYPVVGTVSSTHTVLEIGVEKTVEVGDLATLIGPDDPTIDSIAVAAKTGLHPYGMITKLSALLPRRLV